MEDQLNSFGKISLHVEEDELSQVSSYKYLGVIIDENLVWVDHIEVLRKNITQRLGMLHRVKHLLPQFHRKTIFNTLILPLFDYGDLTWI